MANVSNQYLLFGLLIMHYLSGFFLLTAEGARNARGFKGDERCFIFVLLAGFAVSLYLTAEGAENARGFKGDELFFIFALLAGLAVSFY